MWVQVSPSLLSAGGLLSSPGTLSLPLLRLEVHTSAPLMAQSRSWNLYGAKELIRCSQNIPRFMILHITMTKISLIPSSHANYSERDDEQFCLLWSSSFCCQLIHMSRSHIPEAHDFIVQVRFGDQMWLPFLSLLSIKGLCKGSIQEHTPNHSVC